jgi:hypothetical protein
MLLRIVTRLDFLCEDGIDINDDDDDVELCPDLTSGNDILLLIIDEDDDVLCTGLTSGNDRLLLSSLSYDSIVIILAIVDFTFLPLFLRLVL